MIHPLRLKVQKASSEVPPTPAAPETPTTPVSHNAVVELEGASQLDDVPKAVAQDVGRDAPASRFYKARTTSMSQQQPPCLLLVAGVTLTLYFSP